MRIGELGEFGLIRRIAAQLGAPSADVVVGIGDDVAVLRTGGADYLLATCDAQVENVHFLRDRITPYQLGRKTIAINVSDIASAGGTPSWGLVSLALPQDLDVAFVDELYRGMREEMQAAGATLVGGNMSSIEATVLIDLFLLGQVAPQHLLLRSGARVGDVILVTGSLGDSRAGLELLLHPELSVSEASRRYALDRHLTPHPRLEAGQWLGRLGAVHAMLDVSDGLLSDLGHLCAASGVGAEVDLHRLPVDTACREVAAAAGADPLGWALSGGEDYELLFSAAAEAAETLSERLEADTGCPCRCIGRIVSRDQGLILRTPEGAIAKGADLTGWDHFRAKA